VSDPKADLVMRWFEEVWNKGRESAIHEMLDAQAICHGLSDDPKIPLRGPEGFITFFRKFRNSFPDIHVTVLDTVSEGDKVTARCRATGTHRGHALGIAATQKPMSFEGVAIAIIENGRIVEAWNYWDFMTMYQQLGALKIG
jgi:steroid delta-isomerase-like uncharacterized protein